MNKNRTPKLRFEGFNDEWEKREFPNVFDGLQNNSLSRADLNSESGTVRNVHYGDVLIKFGDYIDASQESLPYITDETKVEKFKGSFLQDGDIVFADTAEDDTAGKCTEMQGTEGMKILAGLHTIACRPKEKYGPKFLGYYINSPAYHDQLKPLMQGIKVTSISKTALQNTNLTVPKLLKEQIQIGEYLSYLDKLIILHQHKIEKLQNMKKSCLQKMFPKCDEAVPEVRFKGFSTAWEKKTLGDCFDERIESMPDGELLSVTIGAGIKRFADLDRHDNSNNDKSKYKKVCVGDIAYNSMRMWQGASGYSPYEGIVSPAYTVVKPKEDIDSRFFSYMFKKKEMIHLFEINSQGLTSDTWNLKYPAFSKIAVLAPTDVNEQKKIAEFLMKMDRMITISQQELELIVRMKKGCLQRLFV